MNILYGIAEFLDTLADELDRKNQECLTGGWSTNQLKFNEDKANECRRKASQMRRELERQGIK